MMMAASLLGASSLMAHDDDDRGRDHDRSRFVVSADLIGYQEVPALSTSAHGHFWALIDTKANTITWKLTYDGLEGSVTQSHVHFGQKSVNGGVSFFLCSNLGNGPAGAVLVYPGLVPTYASFGAAGWGDSAAGLMCVLMLCQAIDMLRAVREHGTIAWRSGVYLGLFAIVAVYFRSSVSLLVVGMLGITFAISLVLARRSDRGRVVMTYGNRDAPYSIDAKVSSDNGETWGPTIVLRSGGGSHDLGYPRTVAAADGTLVTAYYFNEDARTERFIGATRWRP
jgi:hypothetical protein